MSGNIILYKQQIDKLCKKLESVKYLGATESQITEDEIVVDTAVYHEVPVSRPRLRKVQVASGIPSRKKYHEIDGKTSSESYQSSFSC